MTNDTIMTAEIGAAHTIQMCEMKDYANRTTYLVRYGLQTQKFWDLGKALADFNQAVIHAAQCEGLFLSDGRE